jgi:hypothetical protein
MPDVSMPAPVAVAGAALCVLGGYLVGAVTGPDATDESTAEVVRYDAGTDELCLTGEAVEAEERSDAGELCGTWRHRAGAEQPRPGDEFRFVTMSSDDGGDESVTYIYGDVVD